MFVVESSGEFSEESLKSGGGTGNDFEMHPGDSSSMAVCSLRVKVLSKQNHLLETDLCTITVTCPGSEFIVLQ